MHDYKKQYPTYKPYIRFCIFVTIGLMVFSSQLLAQETTKWNDFLYEQYFSGQTIIESDEIHQLVTPVRAENGAIVPIKIQANIPQQPSLYIKKVTLIIDENPVPWAGTFNFSPKIVRASLDLRLRLNAYSNIRAIAETNTGELYMSKRFVKASGGCSAPLGTDIESAMLTLGKIRMRSKLIQDSSAQKIQLAISHPNITGLQMDQFTRNYAPAHFIKDIRVSYEGEEIFSAETDISISQNPNFKFYFIPKMKGDLTAEITDSKGFKFSQVYTVQ